jgi:hypothetical protein
MTVASTSPTRTSFNRRTILWAGIAAAIYLALCLWLFLGIRHANAGHFIFSLDDPYIHMALAEQIAHGTYGINPGEPASPSSSVLWPFLLAPFARFPLPVIVLLFNLLGGLATSLLIGFTIAAWTEADEAPDTPRNLLTILALILIGNLAGLTFVGMEHTLQVFLAGVGALGIISCMRTGKIPTWCLVLAALGPMVRYESLTISVALAIALVGLHQRRKALLLLVASVLPLIAFSLFLHHLKLPLLPGSVLIKGQVVGQNVSAARGFLRSVKVAVFSAPTDNYHLPLFLLFLTLAGMAWKQTDRVKRFALAGAATAAGLHLLFGPFHWFYRYEVYIVFFSALVLLSTLFELPKIPLGWYALALLGCSHLYIQALHDTITNSRDIYLQQYQMHRFVTEFYTGNVAINDLGLVSYHRRPGQQVFDLAGLGSVEATLQKNKNAAWLDAMTHEHHDGLVMIYESGLPVQPADWTRLGVLCNPTPTIFLGGRCVTYFATPMEPVETTRHQFNAFVKTLPPEIIVSTGTARCP